MPGGITHACVRTQISARLTNFVTKTPFLKNLGEIRPVPAQNSIRPANRFLQWIL